MSTNPESKNLANYGRFGQSFTTKKETRVCQKKSDRERQTPYDFTHVGSEKTKQVTSATKETDT